MTGNVAINDQAASDEEKRFSPTSSFAGSFRHPDAFTAAIPGGRFDLVPAAAPDFSARIRVANLANGVSLRGFALSTPIMLRSEMIGGSTANITYMFPLFPDPKARVDGVDLTSNSVFARSPGDTPGFLTGGEFEMATICMLSETVRRASAALTGKERHLLLSPAQARRADPARLAALRAAFLRISRIVGGGEWNSLLNQPAALGLLRDQIETALIEVLDTGDLRMDHLAHRMQTVSMRRIDQLIDDRPDAILGLRDLCEQSGLALRTVESIIRRRMNMTAHAYLQRRRLVAARKALLACGTSATVTEVALTFGFTHLGRFAGFYRSIYGESPSVTRRRGGQARVFL